jgi:hypothetical protein
VGFQQQDRCHNKSLAALALAFLSVFGLSAPGVWAETAPALPQTAPLPPARPFELGGTVISIVTPVGAKPAPHTASAPPSIADQNETAKTSERAKTQPFQSIETASIAGPAKPALIRTAYAAVPESTGRSEGEWPLLTPRQQSGARQSLVVMQDDGDIPPGLSTDPGTSIDCLPDSLRLVLNKVVTQYGAVRVTSTWRPPHRARRGSYHRRCEAVDFRVRGVGPYSVLSYLKTLHETGGHKVYPNGLLHVDTGPWRTWR